MTEIKKPLEARLALFEERVVYDRIILMNPTESAGNATHRLAWTPDSTEAQEKIWSIADFLYRSVIPHGLQRATFT